ncbi:MAG: hypothetical protein Q9180_009471 [Flavoplaca navasiana]
MPAFTTTTQTDVVVASILLMGLTQKYFDFKIKLRCGLPSVTLLGERSDWELILKRTEKLNEYGEEPMEFYKLLRPVISRYMNVPKLELDGVAYHVIEADDIPSGYTSVPVKVDDNGHVFMAKMIAGSVGTKSIGGNTIQPESGWWMFEDDKGQSEERLEGARGRMRG